MQNPYLAAREEGEREQWGKGRIREGGGGGEGWGGGERERRMTIRVGEDRMERIGIRGERMGEDGKERGWDEMGGCR